MENETRNETADIVKDAVVDAVTNKITNIIEGPEAGDSKKLTYREVQTSTERIVKRVCTTAIIVTWIIMKSQRRK